MKNTYLFLAEGFEEIEAIAPLDILRRGNVNVYTVSITDNKTVKGSHGINIIADYTLDEVKFSDAEMMIFPGGSAGAKNLSTCGILMNWLNEHYAANKPIAAICASPGVVLGKLPIPAGFQMTVYPGYERFLEGKTIKRDGVVVCQQIITSRGAAFSLEFGYAILEMLRDKDMSDTIAAGMLYIKNI